MKTWPKWTTTASSLLSLLISSCAGPAAERGYDAPPERVRVAVRAALREFAEVREEGDRFTTGWSERPGAPGGILLGNEARVRVRHEVEVRGTAVEVRSIVERRPPAGPRANRWERTDPGPAETALLKAIGRELEKTP